ncbi:ATP-grasp domain-containing protein [Paenibacillaceae bacterium WGS1546]|uniref:ATP-grasp domain-containing protein n=1 Tax=Cohnella sp. WGS1546 TaxID=3366810 RepID=UPI00372CFE20
MKHKILVTGTSSYGVGEGLIKTINDSVYRDLIELNGASNSKLTAHKDSLEHYYILPNANHANYYDEIKKIIDTSKIDILIPGSEAEMLFFSQYKCEIEKELNVDIWVNECDIIKTFDDKMQAEAFFKENKLNTPKSIDECNGVFPIIIKPTNGKASEGIYIAKNEEQYKAICNLYRIMGKSILAQEFIEKDFEYTVSLINLNNRLEILCMERILNKGATQYAKIVDEPMILEIAKELHRVLGNELILNLQIVQKGAEFYLIEVNPRFSGSAPMRAKLGYNEFDILYAHKYLNKVHEYTLKKEHYCIRGYEEVIYDDRI